MVKILAIDIGLGTQDMLLYNSDERLENSVKMVLSAPTIVYSSIVKNYTSLGKNLFFDGDTIGGGALSHAIKKHVREGHRVLMTEKAAYTVRNRLEEVEEDGIEVVDRCPPNFDGAKVTLREIYIPEVSEFLSIFGEDLKDVDVVAVAVQDHGAPPREMSNRIFRFEQLREVLKGVRKPEDLAFKGEEIPRHFLRMNSAFEAVRRSMPEVYVLIMDTTLAAVCGCLEDPHVKSLREFMIVNFGNLHTMAALIGDGEIRGIFEHHTRKLPPKKMRDYLKRFPLGKVTNEEVYYDQGHGVYVFEQLGKVSKIVATGPNRSLIEDLGVDFYYAAPGGDVMMTGTMGLVRASYRNYSL